MARHISVDQGPNGHGVFLVFGACTMEVHGGQESGRGPVPLRILNAIGGWVFAVGGRSAGKSEPIGRWRRRIEFSQVAEDIGKLECSLPTPVPVPATAENEPQDYAKADRNEGVYSNLVRMRFACRRRGGCPRVGDARLVGKSPPAPAPVPSGAAERQAAVPATVLGVRSVVPPRTLEGRSAGLGCFAVAPGSAKLTFPSPRR